MGMKSKRKGRLGEQQVVLLLKELGFEDARRTAQHSGKGGGKADVECPESLPKVHLEVKNGRPKNGKTDLGCRGLADACHQAFTDSGGKRWCVLWKPTGSSQWRMTFDDYLCSGPLCRMTVSHDQDIAACLRHLNATALKL